jgi:hypothetical protein
MLRKSLVAIALAGLLGASSAEAGKLTTGAVYSSADVTKCRILNAGFEPVSVTIWVMNADTGAIVASNVVGVSPMRNALVSYSGTAPYFCRFEFLGSKRMLRGTLEQVVSGDVSTTLEAH